MNMKKKNSSLFQLFIIHMNFQPGVPAFTVKQPEDAMAVLRDRAEEIGVSVQPEVARWNAML